MTAATTYTFDATTPYRPSLADLGGAEFENDPTYPPDRTTMPNAEEANERARNQAGLNRVCPVAVIHVTFAAGAPVITNVVAMRSAINAGNFTVVNNGEGDTSIRWASTVLPATVIPPVVSIAADVAIDQFRAFLTTESGLSAVRVKTLFEGSGWDCPFVVLIF